MLPRRQILVAGAAALLVLGMCCSLRLPVDETWDDLHDAGVDGDADGDADEGPPDADWDQGRPDADRPGDADEGREDADPDVIPVVDAEADASEDGDGEADLGPCEGPPDPDVLALYTLDDEDLTSAAGGPSGSVEGPTSRTSWVDGPPGCGRALRFDGGTPEGYAVIPDDPAWDGVASIDLYLRLDGGPGPASGVLSRDAAGETLPGHLTLVRGEDDRLGLRLQRAPETVELCSAAPLPLDAWVRVGINLGAGGVELWVDGLRADGTEALSGTLSLACSAPDPPIEAGIDGNDNPWVLGAGAWGSGEGEATPVDAPARVTMDHLRLSRVRRDYAAGE